MKYLDERIILTVPSLTIEEDGLYQYEIGLSDEWTVSDPLFVGNCFIPKGATQRDIDITDIVRNEADFTKDVDFQEEYQVRIKVGENYYYSNSETVLPIYRYPNRKAEMETPIEPLKDGWYIPSLQGFDSQKKAKLLPHIPYLNTRELSYELWMNNGKMTTSPYLYSGVKKNLDNNSYGIRKNEWSLEDLWKSSGYILPATTYDSTLFSTDDNFTKYFGKQYNVSLGRYEIINVSITNSPVFINNIKYYPISTGSEEQNVTPTITGNVGRRHMEFKFNETVSGDGYDYDYIDWYLQYGDNNDFVNLQPTLITPFTSAAYNISFYLNESFMEYGTNLVEIPEGATVVDNAITFSDLTGFTYNIHLKDSEGNNLENAQLGGGLSMPLTSYVDAAKIVISDIINDSPIKTINIVDSEQFNGQNTIVLSWTSSSSTGVTLTINKYAWTGRIYYQIDVTGEQSGSTPEKIQVVDEKDNKRYYNFKKYIPQKGEIDFSNSDDYDNFGDNWISLYFTEEEISENEYAGTEKCAFFIKNKATGEVDRLINFDFYSPDVRNVQVGKPFNDAQIIVYVYNNNIDDYKSKIVMDFSKKTDKYIFSLQFKTEGNDFYVESIELADAFPKDTAFDVATIDYCPSRYYLQWRDRYGSQQTQPFGKTETFSESFTRSEVKNYQNVRRLANVEIQPKWKINSGWLNDSVYPYYESLFVSPYLKLYDAKEDKSYDVIITDSEYTEKTYKNQGNQLFNLELQLEEVKTQKILY